MCIICLATVWAQLNFLGLTLSELHSSGVWFMSIELSGTYMKDDQKQGFWWAAGSSLTFLCMERREWIFLKLHLHICHLGLSAGLKILHSNQCLKGDPKFLESTNFPSLPFLLQSFCFILHAVLLIYMWLLYCVPLACKAIDAQPHCMVNLSISDINHIVISLNIIIHSLSPPWNMCSFWVVLLPQCSLGGKENPCHIRVFQNAYCLHL